MGMVIRYQILSPLYLDLDFTWGTYSMGIFFGAREEAVDFYSGIFFLFFFF
jgi:hypothetical protein